MGITWEKIRELSSTTGQGNVWIVAKRGDSEPTERLLKALQLSIGKSIRTPEEIETGRRDFESAMHDFMAYKYVLGAMKQLKNPNDLEAKERLRTEIDVYEKISDPHLVALLDQNLSEDWIVTEFQPNKTLDDRLAQFRGNALETLHAIRGVVGVLAKMHSHGFTHRDFKPGNIFVGRTNQLVLCRHASESAVF